LLVVGDPIGVRRRLWIRLFLLGGIVAAIAIASLVPYLTSGSEVTKLRNALLMTDLRDVDFDWTPDRLPPAFKWERGPVDPFFAQVAQNLKLVDQPDDWARAVAITHHLLSSAPLNGGALHADLRGTYRGIVEHGDGYCGDFVRAFVAIALAAGMPVRSWAFSFDGFGGQGHVWPEIWNRSLQTWQLVGVFNNNYFYETPGVPLSALGLRAALLLDSPTLRLAAIDPSARPGWTIEAKAWSYYRRGLPEWYMWWGNNRFEYDRAPLVRLFAGISRPLEQFSGILHGVSPRLQVLSTPQNQVQVDRLHALRRHVILALGAVVIGFLVMATAFVGGRLWLRRQGSVA
jgi:hypothetical protein